MNIATMRRLSALEETKPANPVYRRLIIEAGTTDAETNAMVAAAQKETGPNGRIILRTIVASQLATVSPTLPI